MFLWVSDGHNKVIVCKEYGNIVPFWDLKFYQGNSLNFRLTQLQYKKITKKG